MRTLLALVTLLLAIQPSSQTRTQVVLLGTGTPRPDPERSGPATAIVVDGTAYLVDIGPGIVRRAAAAFDKGVAALAPDKLQTAFITHLHSDHTVGYPDLIFTTWVQGRRGPLKVYRSRRCRSHDAPHHGRVGGRYRHPHERSRTSKQGGPDRRGTRCPPWPRLRGRQRQGERLSERAWRMAAIVRLSVQDGRPNDRHLGRHQPQPRPHRALPEVRRSHSRGVHRGVPPGGGAELD